MRVIDIRLEVQVVNYFSQQLLHTLPGGCFYLPSSCPDGN